VTKKEIVKLISDSTGVPQLKTKEIVQKTFNAIIETLISEKRIELRKFGVFEVKRRKARKARNPRTGAQVNVEPKNVVTFQPGKEMEERVRRMALVEEKPRQARKARLNAAAAAGSDGAAVATSRASENAALPAGGPAATPVNGDSDHGSDGADGGKKRRAKKEV